MDDYATSREAADPWCLRDGEAKALLAGHPWRRFAVLGDSVAEAVFDPIDGYAPVAWCDRVAAELRGHRPELAYLNLGRRNLRAAQIREEQLAGALAFGPDLALVACGANDAMDPRYKFAAVARELTAMVDALRAGGCADIMTVGVLVLVGYPGIPAWLRTGVAERIRALGDSTRELSAELGTIHIDLTWHPAGDAPGMHSDDGLHGNGRSHAISAAEAVRRLGAHLGNVTAS